MLSFHAFRKSTLDKVENYRKLHNSTVDGEHGHVNSNGVPCAVVYHGSHSKKKRKPGKKPAKKVVKEDASQQKKEWPEINDNKHVAFTTMQAHFALHKHYDDRPADHEKALFQYTHHSSNLNRTLYKAHVEGKEPPKKVNSFEWHEPGNPVHDVAKLDEALAHKTLPHKLHVYSGVNFDPNEIASKHPDRHIHLPAYTSSSIEKEVGMKFAANNQHDSQRTDKKMEHAHVLHIELPKGHHGAYMGSKSAYHTEREFIIPRNTTLKVHPEPIEHEDAFGMKYRVWHATPVTK